ncbi:MAG TPA: histidine phosphatase family protein [Burkholderiaceae bacterium]|nr:histidine phosphatase family protein [Burkholderiaceae bacterium]
MTPTTLLVIRHGETAWNAEHRIQGHLDIPLSPAGMRQAACLAERLGGAAIDAVYSSELARAWLTAAPLAERLGLEIVSDTRLRERSFGLFEGLTLDEIATQHPEAFRRWRERDPAWTVEGGESGLDLIDRVLEALHDIVARHPGGTVAVVTHGGVLDVVYRAARTLPWDAPRQHQMLNASINRLSAAAPPLTINIIDWADVAHLAQARDETLT